MLIFLIVLGVTVLDALIIYLVWKRKSVRPIGFCWLCRSEIFEPYCDHFSRAHDKDWPLVKEKPDVRR